MKKMFAIISILSLFVSCTKEIPQVNYLPGKWGLVETALYQGDSLNAVSVQEEISTVYYFGSCETSHSQQCEMYIEEDGESSWFSYLYDESNNLIILNNQSTFEVMQIQQNQLVLQRSYDNYKSTYRFIRSE
ncbi:MAG: hypothetical protein IPM74_08915 [Crocinitomicaceae bacterium]|nr:hypothetical protein [Crocinitomicaceae bacterium]MBK8926011.1 hypothetical protein [Crocinitomicaceae bacterium]